MKKWKNYLKKNNCIIVPNILLLCLTNCNIIFEDTSISPEILPYFKIGDTIIYSCNSLIDSFYVEEATFYAVGVDDGSHSDWDYERFISIIIQQNCVDSCYEFRSVINPSEYNIGILGFKFSGYKLLNYYSGYNLEIGKYKLDDLYGSYNLKPDSVTGKEINYVLYSKKYGVVEYKLNNGEAYQITEDCITMLKARE